LRAIVLSLLMLLAPAVASSDEGPRWNPISGSSGFRSEASGDPRSEDGARASIDSLGTASGPFGGVIGALDLAEYRGREIRLSARIEVVEGSGSAAIWVRADIPGRQPGFATSAGSPVVKGERQERELRLYVPADSSKLVLGAIVQGEARALVSRLKVAVLTSPTSGVDAHAIVETAFDLVEAHALHAPKANLTALRARLLTDALRGAPPPEAYSRIAELLEALGDGHSFALPPAQAATHRDSGQAARGVDSRLIDGSGYVLVPAFRGVGTEATAKFAGDVCHALAGLAPAVTKGWVVDLRENTGGNMWPMLRGLAPLLGAGTPGSFRDRNQHDEPWKLDPVDTCSAAIPQDARVAVLLGPRTASSGEAVAVAFSGRPNTRSFGRPTAGKSTANKSVALPDGGMLFLTSAIDVDRNGKTFPAGVAPDVEIEFTPQADGALAAALAWLGERR
jgi:carboxyl-terminal processing protease